MEKPIKIAIVGPESTGKSVLAAELASHYNTVFVPEFARAYLSGLNRKYTYEDVLYIAEKQLQLELEIEQQNSGSYIFYDTTLLTIKIWLQVVFGKVPDVIQKKLSEKNYDLYLLTDIDMPWEPDPLREHPNFREQLLQMHIKELQELNATYEIISGVGLHRFNNAKTAILDYTLR